MKDIIITEGGRGREFEVKRLETALQAGGSCYWVPEDEHTLTTKYITENGEYPAAVDEKWGYSSVSVSISGGTGVTGRGADGNEYYYTVDEDGYLVDEKLPSSIRVTTNPATMAYAEGATIDYTGMVVTSYDANDTAMDEIALANLTLPVTTAHDEGEGTQTLPVKWNRTGDLELLETSITISVS